MRLIYATGTPRQLEFAVAPAHSALPAGARVLAVCDGEHFEGRLDGNTFDHMTDQEYYTLQSLISEARRSELRTASVRAASAASGLRHLVRRLLGAPANA